MEFTNSINVPRYCFAKGAIGFLPELLAGKEGERTCYFIDECFEHNQDFLTKLPLTESDVVKFVSTKLEPRTDDIDAYLAELKPYRKAIKAVVGIGGGITLDTAKAVSNMLTNPGKAEDYQGWDLLKNPGVYKIGIPTISGTGAETSKTCVLTNPRTGLKLGMNSAYTLFDQLILDPELTKTVPRDAFFFTAMDAYIHSTESLNGSYRNAIGDAFAQQAITLCREVFNSDELQSDENCEKIMVASYLSGCSLANSFVGIIHPLSAGLGIVLGVHHCLANCMVLNQLGEFYPEAAGELKTWLAKHQVSLPEQATKDLQQEGFTQLYNSSIIHEKPLINALGSGFKDILTVDKVTEIYQAI